MLADSLETLVKNILNKNISDLSDLDKIKNNAKKISKIYFPVLSKEIDNFITKRNETNYKTLYCSMQLAGYLEDKNAFFLILKILNLPIDIIEEFLGEHFVDIDLQYILAYTANDSWESLKKIIEDPSIDKFIRENCIKALKILVFRDKINRLDVLNYFKSYLNKIINEEVDDDEMATSIIASILDLYPYECLEEIKELFGLYSRNLSLGIYNFKIILQ
ncbi:MAG: hypothetical protein AMS24_04895 [Chlamydiae bacterium SM23_39]|nr:MAG: hypothetical protein AMS24_04895 [Chlamydiae bacterium SM23_39]